MSAPFLWILLPIGMGALLLLVARERVVTVLGGLTTGALSLLAMLIPIDTALLIGTASFKLQGTFSVLGRSFTLLPAHGPLLAILFGLATLWFFGAESLGLSRRLIPVSMMILGLLVASTAVQPFIFAALLIEIASLLAVPMLLPPNRKPGRGLVRFVIYQTLAMPFILFAGWLLTSIETSPGDARLTNAAIAMLGMGFALLLAFFPLNVWIPMLFEETSPYLAGFLMWLLPLVTALFAMGFLDRYSFLRGSEQLLSALRLSGLLMVFTSGLLSAFERHLGRLMGYAIIAETGFLLISLSLGNTVGVQAVFMQMIPRGIIFAVWAYALTIIAEQADSLRYYDIQGALRVVPIASIAIIAAGLSVAGLPLLGQFPARLTVLQTLATQSPDMLAWVMLGVLGMLVGVVRTVSAMAAAPAEAAWESHEETAQRIWLGAGMLALFVLGVLPQIMNPLLKNLPALFSRLGG